MEKDVAAMVHACYWEKDLNCARTTLQILGELFGEPIGEQLYLAAAGMHGAGGYGAQCGLVEGALLFLGAYFGGRGMDAAGVGALCRDFAAAFSGRFSSLLCSQLRPGGFSREDEPHLCEALSVQAICFARDFIRERACPV